MNIANILRLAMQRSGLPCVLLTFAVPLTLAQVPTTQNAPAPQQQQRPPQGWAVQQRNQAWAAQKLGQSPRRNEWVTLRNGSRALKAWVVYPDTKRKSPFVLVLHEVFGLTDSTRNTADEIAAMGYIAITPDMLSGYGPHGGNIDSFEPPYSASQTVTSLEDKAVNSDLNAWADYGDKLSRSSGQFAIVGLSWGGGAAFRYATTTRRKDLKAVCVFYDIGPPAETQSFAGAPSSLSVAAVGVPVYGFYGSTDTRPLLTLQATKDAMAGAGKAYDPVVYEGADHAFMRVGEDPAGKNPANPQAVKASLNRLRNVLGQNLK